MGIFPLSIELERMGYMKLKHKAAIGVGILVALIIGMITSIAILDARSNEIENNERYVTSELNVAAGTVNDFLNESIKITEDLARYTQSTIKNNNFDIETFNDLLKQTLSDHDRIYGIWLRLEDSKYVVPGSIYTDTGAYDPYFYREGDQVEYTGLKAAGWLENEVDGAFYYDAYNSGEIYMYEPIVWEINGVDVEMVTVAYPIIVNNQVEGAIGIDISIDYLNQYMSSLTIYDSGQFLISYTGDYESDNFTDYSDLSLAYTLGNPGNWRIFVDIPEDEMLDFTAALVKLIAIGAVGIIIAMTLIVFILNNILKPVTYMTNSLEEISEFNLKIDSSEKAIKYSKRNDEIGAMTRSIRKLERNFVDLIQTISDKSQLLASSSEELTATTNISVESAEEIATTIDEISRGAVSQAQDTEKGAENISLMGELVNEDKRHRQELNSSTSEIDVLKDEGLEVLSDLIEKTEVTNTSIQEIMDVIEKTKGSASEIETKSLNLNLS